MIKIFNDKIDKIKLNKNNFYVLADFDNTITEKHCDSNIGSINRSKIFERDFYQEIQKIYDEYKIEILNAKDYDEKDSINSKKIKDFFEIYKKYNITSEMIENVMINSGIEIRKDMIKFFKYLHKNKIPVIIISAGMSRCIEILLKNNEIYYENITIIANNVEFNEEGKINNIPDKIINPVNKNKITFSKRILEEINGRDYILLFGDVPGDIKMIGNKEKSKTISIAFDNNKGNLLDLEKEFDIISSDGSVLKMLEEKIKNESYNAKK